MTAFADHSTTSLTEAFGEAWNRFWFTPADPRPVAWLRIAIGLLAAAHFVALTPGLEVWYARDGALSPAAVERLLAMTSGSEANYHYSYLNYLPASPVLTALHALAIGVALAFAAGFLTRISGVLTLIALLAYIHRVPQVAGHIEPLLAFLVAYLCIAPSGACWSVDRWLGLWRNQGTGENAIDVQQPSVAANIGLRMVQVHLAMFYAMLGLAKLYGDAWWDGGAVWLLLAQTESRPLNLTGVRRAGQLGEYFLNFWTHGIVYFQLAFPVLVWLRMLRPIVLAVAVVVWLSVIGATGLLLFGLTMIATLLAFLPATSSGPCGPTAAVGG